MAICSKCIVPDSYPNVKIQNGECSFCQSNSKILGNKSKTNQDKILQSTLELGKEEKYNCIVPISGGKDSSYILYYLVKKMGLNPLAVYFDSGFATEEAKNNVKGICEKLNVDLVIKYASPYRRKIVQHAWKVSYYTGRVGSYCTNCENNIRTVAINEAKKQGTKYIIWGSTDYEDSASSLLKPSASHFRDEFASFKLIRKQMYSTLISIGKIILRDKISVKSKVSALFHYMMFLKNMVLDNIKLNAPGGFYKFTPYLQVSFRNKKTETLYFYDYIPYDPFYQIKILEENVGWKAPADREAKMDCLLHDFSNFTCLKRTGLTDSGFKLAVLARNDMISRDEALKKEKKEIEFLKNYFQSEDLDIRPALDVMKKIIFNGVSNC
ncbi:hypothetical protein D1164_19375 [Mariniphaga sediminis]|uniref:N-acetyl sugar amidotransferase n=1 Tax=Mariniphaga sediminis TaxID=1628158 RepID=A0A399CW39_9BACT|nr:phosphoadenosine phosphosulfate reductase family protein [Mariniphaga sediminis]RIH63443.1 hypothetical protein D1164_19375 [Mariniphaga sediminis]